MVKSILSLLAIASLSNLVYGHMEMTTPYALRSKYNSQNNNPDYSNISPLNADGSNYPCKGYQNDAGIPVVATYTAGQTYQLGLTGGANHGGGSCQLSLSYDHGATFTIIKSMIGGCATTTAYPFTIPQNAPTGQALFAWTWFNKVGNREMYMNCALVKIIGSSSANTLSGPQIFIANLGNGLSTCGTIEGDEVVFPKRGSDVVYGGMWGGTTPATSSNLATCSYKGEFQDTGSSSSNGPISSSGYSSSSDKSTTTRTSTIFTTVTIFTTYKSNGIVTSSAITTWTTKAATTTTTSATPIISSAPTLIMSSAPSSSANINKGGVAESTTKKSTKPKKTGTTLATSRRTTTAQTTSSFSSSAAIPIPSSSSPSSPSTSKSTTTITTCAQGTILCSALGDTWSLCSDGKYISMGTVASQTVCVNGQIIRRSDGGSCSTSGMIKCAVDGKSWYMCSMGGYVSMGPVAAGTKCVNGGIVAA